MLSEASRENRPRIGQRADVLTPNVIDASGAAGLRVPARGPGLQGQGERRGAQSTRLSYISRDREKKQEPQTKEEERSQGGQRKSTPRKT